MDDDYSLIFDTATMPINKLNLMYQYYRLCLFHTYILYYNLPKTNKAKIQISNERKHMFKYILILGYIIKW